MNKLDSQYLELVQDILDNGIIKTDRTGVGTIGTFGRQIRHKMSEGFPILTSKKVAWKPIVSELLWFLRGDTNIKWLLENNNKIWVGDCYKKYKNTLIESGHVPLNVDLFIDEIIKNDGFSYKWGDLGPIYGKQWRKWGNTDQVSNIINDLKSNPDSRRLIVNSWNVEELNKMVLPPCHPLWQLYSYELDGKRYLSLMFTMRSNDVPLGLPFNISSYGLLLEIISHITNMIPDELICNTGDTHIYLNQIEAIKSQLNNNTYKLPKLNICSEFWLTESGEAGVGDFTNNIDELIQSFMIDDFELVDYNNGGKINIPLSN